MFWEKNCFSFHVKSCNETATRLHGEMFKDLQGHAWSLPSRLSWSRSISWNESTLQRSFLELSNNSGRGWRPLTQVTQRMLAIGQARELLLDNSLVKPMYFPGYFLVGTSTSELLWRKDKLRNKRTVEWPAYKPYCDCSLIRSLGIIVSYW